MHSNNIISAPAIIVKNAFLAYQRTVIFKNLNFILPRSKWTSLLGPSGVGKSTLLRLLANLTSPDTHASAEITVSNKNPLAMQITYMGQTDLLLPWLNVLDNILLTTRLRKYTSVSRQLFKMKALELLKKVGLSNSASEYPRNLSGGMRQRVALVRTLIENKPVVLMDEPFSSLDAITRYHLQNLAVELLRERTVLFVTHDPVEALRVSDEIIVM
jgi:putative hydroxymethylpyrimidine transport system ATP-binding protein